MRPIKLEMHNFMPYAQPTSLDLSGIHLACLAGDNGHGKSAIIDAITWALWGKARARRDDELIHLGEEQMEVRVEFVLGDVLYRVIRQRDSSGRGSSALEFQISHNGQFRPLTGDSIKETQEAIIDTLHLDYETFINSALLLQGRADEFTNQRPGERKRILGDILGLELYDKLEARAKERVRAAEMKLAEIEARAQQMNEDLERQPDYEAELDQAAQDVERLAQELKHAQAELRLLQQKQTEGSLKQQALADVRAELDKRRDEQQQLESRLRDLDTDSEEKYKQRLESVRARIEELTALEPRRKEIEAKQVEAAQRITALQTMNAQLRQEMDGIRGEMDILAGAEAECPLCGTKLTPEHRDEILSEKESEGTAKAAKYSENAAELSSVEKSHRERKLTLINIENKLAQMDEARKTESNLMAWLSKQQSVRERQAEWQEQAANLATMIMELMAKRDAIEDELGRLAEIQVKLRTWEVKVSELGDEVSRANLRVGAATQKIEHCQYLRAEKENLEDQHEKTARQQAIYDELKLAFGKRGIQAMIIETVLPEIEEQANALLAKMTDGSMSVAFESQRETQKGSLMETLDIHVSDELGTRSYDLFSGGEAFRINFAIRIAISKLLAQRAGARLETLIMDEGFGSQDLQGRDRLVEAINSVRDDFGLVLVITHIDELKQSFDNRIEVVKGPAGSTISVN